MQSCWSDAVDFTGHQNFILSKGISAACAATILRQNKHTQDCFLIMFCLNWLLFTEYYVIIFLADVLIFFIDVRLIEETFYFKYNKIFLFWQEIETVWG